MKILLLHLEDWCEEYAERGGWDLIVDLGRAPVSTYEGWSRLAGCRIVSVFDFAQADDLHQARELIQAGVGLMVDQSGIDWWEVLSIMITSQLLQLMLVRRLAKELVGECELYTSRPSLLASALAAATKSRLISLENSPQAWIRRLQHLGKVARKLDSGQMFQMMQDKFDSQHKLRRRLWRKLTGSHEPLVLLPSAYVNVSRTVIAYAAMLPSQRFLLIYARDCARLSAVPSNVQTASLDPYFVSPAAREMESLRDLWSQTKRKLLSSAEEFLLADAGKVLDPIPAMLDWGVAIRNAWENVFQSQNITACLCADDSNPYTRIPLIMAKRRSLPTVACHHGAMDSMMAVKQQHADHYLVKTDMERDYVERFCRVGGSQIVTCAPGGSTPTIRDVNNQEMPWQVLFSEPYDAWFWRNDEVCRELLPRLMDVAENLGFKFVIKIHPFESTKTHRRRLVRYLGSQRAARVLVLDKQLSLTEWAKTGLALTVQSTVALECACREIPIFLLTWLQDPFSGYSRQFARFGIGHTIDAAAMIAEIPRMLRDNPRPTRGCPILSAGEPEVLRRLLSVVEQTFDCA